MSRSRGVPRDIMDDVDARANGHHPINAINAINANPKELPAPTPFPTSALPKACATLVSEASAAIGCPPDHIGMPMLVALSGAIGNARVIKLKQGWTEGAAIYGGVVARPGGKKTPAEKVAIAPAHRRQAVLREAYRKDLDEHKRELREHEVAKADARKDGEAAPPPPESPTMERTVIEDATVEAVAVILGSTPRGITATKDELSGWVRGMDQYKAGGKGADRQFWLSAWSNSYVAVDRKTQEEPLILQRPFVSILGGIQPEILPELGQGRDDGLLDRFLFAYPNPVPSRWSDDEISESAEKAYADLYNGLYELHMYIDDLGDPEPKSVTLAADAKPILIDAINSHREEMERPGFPRRLEGPYSKLEAYFARLCLILALARSIEEGTKAETVKADDVLRAMTLLHYFKNHARRVYIGLYGENPDDRLAADVTTFLEERGGAWDGQPTELYEQLQSDYKSPRADELSKRLEGIATHTSGLFVERGNRWVKELQNQRRFITLRLENGVNGVNGVKA